MKGLSKSKKVETVVEEEQSESLATLLNLTKIGIPEGYEETEKFPLNPPFCYVTIAQNFDTSDYLYVVDELPMNLEEKATYNKIRELLERELVAPPEKISYEESFRTQLSELISTHKDEINSLPSAPMKKVVYYLERDISGFAKIDPIMHDPLVEDVSCGGVRKPIFVWHKNYESVKTNIYFESEQELDDFIVRLIHRSGKHVSTAFPIVDATLPGKHRLAVLYRRELTPFGTSFTIRKFRDDPYTVIDLIEMGTASVEIVAYLWLLVENKMSVMVLGSTGGGKTTALNAISCLIKPSAKIFTVEEVSEINLPHENWFTLVARSGFGLESQGEIPLYDLIKSGVRHRPDFIIVGEIRGEEAYVLFQALATGHGGLCTMHADSVDTALKRLTQKPMNIPPANLSLMNCAIVVKREPTQNQQRQQKRASNRKFVQVAEIESESSKDMFRWKPLDNIFEINIQESNLLKRIAEQTGTNLEQLFEELERRKVVLQWMQEQRKRHFHNVNEIVASYHRNPERVYARALAAVGD